MAVLVVFVFPMRWYPRILIFLSSRRPPLLYLKGKNVTPISGKIPPLLKKSGVPSAGGGKKRGKTNEKR
tara:strand:- start:93 stop:299 length:207 start_codon:yes stop_codon:yes gene_type:complete